MISTGYHPRKMRADEFKTAADVMRKGPRGLLAHFAMEAPNGEATLNLTWPQAVEMAAQLEAAETTATA